MGRNVPFIRISHCGRGAVRLGGAPGRDADSDIDILLIRPASLGSREREL
jgi:hypothetical protein